MHNIERQSAPIKYFQDLAELYWDFSRYVDITEREDVAEEKSKQEQTTAENYAKQHEKHMEYLGNSWKRPHPYKIQDGETEETAMWRCVLEHKEKGQKM